MSDDAVPTPAVDDRDAADLHVPVMRDRIVELLAPALDQPGAVAVDGTLGMGGHTEALLEAFGSLTVLGIDRDRDALGLAGRRLDRFRERFVPVHAVYDEVADVVARHGRTEGDRRVIDGALFDLGVSSLQLDERDRGFAYRHDAPLDMRMNQAEGRTAADVLNTYPVEELVRILRTYGEERFAPRIARAIVAARAETPFDTSERLVRLLHDAVPAASQRTGGHPAKRTFQALRIEVNGELETWERALPAALGCLAVGGRVAVLSYHSLEDRITKQTLAAGAASSAPAGLPVELPEHAPWLRLVTRGAEQPDQRETTENPRAASARLRVAERTRQTPDSTTRTVRRTGKGHRP